MAFRNVIKYRTKGLTSNILNLRMTEVFSQNVGLLPLMERMLLRPYSKRKSRKDSDFEHTDDGESYEYSGEALTQQLDDKMSELKSHARFTRKIMTKKSIAKMPKQPRMVTYCEVLLIRSLHSSNPDEWTPEILSESFPLLPHMIKTLVKDKWIPESQEKVKHTDRLVLENWEKLKRGELKVSPEYHDHLKKFINKSNVLKLQINNPNFSYLPPEKNDFENTNPVFSSLIHDYEKELNSVTKEMAKPLLKRKLKKDQLCLTDGTANALILKDDTANVSSLKESNSTELKSIIKEKELIQEWTTSSRFRGRPVTLDELKRSIFRKVEKCHSVSESDIEIVKRTMTRHHLPPFPLTGTELAVCSEKINEEALSKATEVKPRKSNEEFERAQFKSTGKNPRKSNEEFERAQLKSTGKNPRKSKEEMEETENASYHNENLGEEESSSEGEFENLFPPSQLPYILRSKSKTPLEKEEEISKPKKTEVHYYGTEKDKLVYKKMENDISGTIFWKSEKRSQSLYSKLSIKPDGNKFGPHCHVEKTGYPEKIEIPVGAAKKGKLYKLNDCYYDHKGYFLYRVPGMGQ